MAIKFELTGELREEQGKGASRRLRREGKVPAILYGGGKEPRRLSLDHDSLMHQLEHDAFFTHILNIKVGDVEQEAILKDIQRHPAKRRVMHLDLQRIVEGQEIRMTVPFHLKGEEIAEGVKLEGGAISQVMADVDIVCMPKDLPEYIEIDVSSMKIGDAINLSEVVVPEGVRFEALAQGDEFDQPVVSCHHIRVTVEEEPEEEVEEGAAEVPVVGEEDKDDDKAED
ncbi:MAG: 50S ribosomal protein L25/general stress protein Ctc [Gammaproteobacteria bacterium]|nr:50S ribosomal protein L25/general stress protein Ctc [Gammaproteobacteria bacterium]